MRVPPSSLPLRVFPRNDSEPPLNVMFADGSHVPEVWASVRERLAKSVNVDDPGAKVRVVGPEAPSFHKVEKIEEHVPAVCGRTAMLEGPADPAEGVVPIEGAPGPAAGELTAPGATVAEAGPDAAKSLLTVGT